MGNTRAQHTCPQCGGNTTKPKYCSLDCYLKHRWKGSGACRLCGKQTEHLFCSAECRGRYRERDRRPYRTAQNWAERIAVIAALGGKCSECDCKDIRLLDLHHTVPSDKHGRCSHWHHRIKDWKANIDTLSVLCVACHRKHTWEQQSWGQCLPCHEINTELIEWANAYKATE